MWGIDLRYIDEVSLARQIFLSMKQRILAGQLSQGEALPSTRELARGLSVSRNTVCEAYDMLLTEGFIVRRQGAPTRVAEGFHLAMKKAPLPVDASGLHIALYFPGMEFGEQFTSKCKEAVSEYPL